MRKVAISIKAMQAHNARAAERARLSGLATIPQAEKTERISALEAQIDACLQEQRAADKERNEEHAATIARLEDRIEQTREEYETIEISAPEYQSTKESCEARIAVLEGKILEEKWGAESRTAAQADKYNQKIAALQAQIDAAMALTTHEEKEATLASLTAQDQEFCATYGPQSLTAEDFSQAREDELGHEHYVKFEKYKKDRREAYPAVTDQLDALMKYFASVDHPLPDDLQAVVDECMRVKAAIPKPESDHG